MFKLNDKHLFAIKLIIHLANLLSFAYLIAQTLNGGFGVDPVQAITFFTGKAALHVLFLTLLITPIAKKFKLGIVFRTRRLLGLYTFFWASLHIITYFWLNLALDFSLLTSEIVKRPYLSLGAICWFILLALAMTSTQALQRRMGKNWQKLHNWVYLVLLFAPIHFYWSRKSEVIEPSIYILLALVLLLMRKDKLMNMFKKRS